MMVIAATITVGVTLLLAIVGSHVRTSSRLTAIETRLDERDRGTKDRAELYQSRAERAMRDWCETSCPRGREIDTYQRRTTAPRGVPILGEPDQ